MFTIKQGERSAAILVANEVKQSHQIAFVVRRLTDFLAMTEGGVIAPFLIVIASPFLPVIASVAWQSQESKTQKAVSNQYEAKG